MNDVISDVWQLESGEEEQAAQALLMFYVEPAMKGNKSAQRYLSRLWDEKWSSIKRKLETEGSVWYVWWMDGVHEFMRKNIKRSRRNK